MRDGRLAARTQELDVAIIGGGMAGSLLARQLRRTLPSLRVGLFEKASAGSYKVGEAMVEISSNHLIRRHGLTGYLYEKHLPKNGLRFFFDSPERDAPLEAMSEIGSINLPFHPAFQIDRAALETDLLEMNRNDGVQVHTGTTVRGIAFGDAGAPHRFEAVDERGVSPCQARWLVDAAGRTGLFARLKDLRVPESEHAVGSVWGRFESVADIDALGPEAYRARVRYTSRRLSTLHFWYPGYWVWFIPLRGGVTSVGITGERVRDDRELRTPEGFQRFLLEHRAIAQLLEDAKLLDLGSYARIAYGTRRFFSDERWGLCGEAATAADPLYSPGGDFIALENDYLCDLIARDLGGEDIAERCRLYDEFMQFRHEAAMRLYRGLYSTLGSFPLACIKWDFDIGCYYNLWTSSYMTDQHLDPEYLNTQLRIRPFVLQALDNFGELFRRAQAALEERGDYFAQNQGRFHYGLANIDFAEEVGEPRSGEAVDAKTLEIFNAVRARTLALVEGREAGEPPPSLPLASFIGRRAIA